MTDKKVNTLELAGSDLDIVVATIEQWPIVADACGACLNGYSPSTKWEHGGPIIAR